LKCLRHKSTLLPTSNKRRIAGSIKKLEEIKSYGVSMGIKEEQMPSEKMIEDPWK